MRAFAAAARALEPVDTAAWRGTDQVAHAQYLASLEPPPTPGDRAARRDRALARRSPAGRRDRREWRRQLLRLGQRLLPIPGLSLAARPTSGSMGYGTPAAIAAKLVHPERTVLCFAGDGCFLMTGQELATAAQYHLPVIWIVANNRMYGTIRMHQERDYPGRVSGTDLESRLRRAGPRLWRPRRGGEAHRRFPGRLPARRPPARWP